MLRGQQAGQRSRRSFPPVLCVLIVCDLYPQCSLVLTSDASALSTNRLRSIRKYQTPVVGVEYVSSCLERGVLLPVDGYRLDASSPSEPSIKSKETVTGRAHSWTSVHPRSTV